MSSIRFVSTRLSGAAAMALAACAGEETAANDDASSAASSGAALSAALPVGAGGGDRDLQTTLADAAPAGATPITMETVADGLAHPWGLAWLPNGDMLISERAGRLRVVRDGALVAEPIAGTPPALVDNQAGYFDVLPHPDFSENNVLYLAYAHGTKDENALRIVRGQFDGASLNDLETIYEATPLKDTSHHFGGKMAWGPAGKLYFTIGEGSRYKERAQLADTSFGAVVRLNEDGSIPDDNPTWPVEGALPELYSKGHRNPQGLAFGADGALYEHEHGPRGGDELNVIEPGANYGWPLASYGIDYNGSRITPYTEIEGTVQPIHYWTPSIAASGLAYYQGQEFPEWNGDLLVGALAGTALHRLDMENGAVVGEERYLVDLGLRIREVRVGPDGAVYVTTNDSGNRGENSADKVIRLTRGE